MPHTLRIISHSFSTHKITILLSQKQGQVKEEPLTILVSVAKDIKQFQAEERQSVHFFPGPFPSANYTCQSIACHFFKEIIFYTTILEKCCQCTKFPFTAYFGFTPGTERTSLALAVHPYCLTLLHLNSMNLRYYL